MSRSSRSRVATLGSHPALDDCRATIGAYRAVRGFLGDAVAPAEVARCVASELGATT